MKVFHKTALLVQSMLLCHYIEVFECQSYSYRKVMLARVIVIGKLAIVIAIGKVVIITAMGK